MQEPTAVTCAVCHVSRTVKPTAKGAPRTPTGWKNHEGKHYCATCWRKSYVLRAISIPISGPTDCTWDDLRAALKTVWRETTHAANRIMTECYARDVRRKPGDEKMPPMPKVYLYPELRAEFPGLPSQSVSSIEQSCQRKYRAARYEVVWTAGTSLPVHRYPVPFPVPSQAWTVSLEDARVIVSLPLPHGEEKRMRLRLRSGAQFRRQLAQVKAIIAGEAIRGEAAIYERGDAVMVKLVAWLPRAAAQERSGTLIVRTAADSFLIAVNAKDETLWKYNGDQIRRWAGEHRTQLQRWSEDAKFENRPVANFAERRTAAGRKFRDRMDSVAHEIAAQLAGYADRRKFAAVSYNDSVRNYCEAFPWYRLRSLIYEKLDARGIEFIASSTPEEKSKATLAEDKSTE